MADLDLWNNLVHVVFGNEIFFGLVMLVLLAWYTIVYDLSWWVFGLFSALFFTWLAFVLIGEWVMVVIAIGVAFFLATQIFRKLRT